MGMVGGGIAAGLATGWNPKAVKMGASIGWQVGSALGRLIFKNRGPDADNEKSRHGDYVITSAAYGTTRPIVYGTVKLAGNIIWTSGIKTTANAALNGHNTVSNADDEGKGGNRASAQETQDPEFYASLAIAFCEGPAKILKIFADGKKIYDKTTTANYTSTPGVGKIQIYEGDTTQVPSAVIESFQGAGNVPAYRGTCYIVIDAMPLKDYGNRVPNITAEITSTTTAQYPVTSVEVDNGVASDGFVLSKRDPFLYALNGGYLTKVDQTDGTVLLQRDMIEAIHALPQDTSDPTSDTIGEGDVIQFFGKLIINEHTDHLYLPVVTDTDDAYLVMIDPYTLQPKWHNYGDKDSAQFGDGVVVRSSIAGNDTEYIYVSDDLTGGVRAYSTPNLSNGGQFTLIFTATGPSSHGISGSWTTGNFTVDTHGQIWYVLYDNSVSNKNVIGRVLPSGGIDFVLSTFSEARSKRIAYEPQEDVLILFSGGRYVLKYTAPVYPTNTTLDDNLDLTSTGGEMRACALSQSRIGGRTLYIIHNTGGSASIKVVKTNTMTVESDTVAGSWGLTASDFTGGALGAVGSYIWMADTVSGELHRLGLNRLAPTTFTLGQVVADIFSRAGLESNEYSNSDLTTELPDTVTGYAIMRVTSARNALEPLMAAYLFDIAEIDGELVAKKRDGEALTGAELDDLFADPEMNVSVTGTDLTLTSPGTITSASSAFNTSYFQEGVRIKLSGWGNSENNTYATIVTASASTITVTDTYEGNFINESGNPTGRLESWIVFPIHTDQLGVHETGTEAPSRLTETQIQEAELPWRVTISYLDPLRDYEPHAQYAQRNTGASTATMNSRADMTLELPLVGTASFAKSLAKKLLLAAWTERRSFEIWLGPRWLLLDPMDVIVLTVGPFDLNVRLTEVDDGANLVRRMVAVREKISNYAVSVAGVNGYELAPPDIRPIVPSLDYMLDLPILRDMDNFIGEYIAGAPVGSGTWHGMTVYRSVSDGSHSPMMYVKNPATLGTVDTVLHNNSPINSFDNDTSIEVTLVYGSLTTSTEEDVLAGANLVAVGQELIQFVTATSLGSNRWRLEGLLRYRYGTDWAGGSHYAGEPFLLIEESTVRRLALSSAELDIPRYHRAVTVNRRIDTGTRTQTTNTGIAMKPYAPAPRGMALDYESGVGILISFHRRTRLGGHWRDYVEVPLGEASESYEIDVYQTSGDTYKRTLTATNSNPESEYPVPSGAVIYTDAQQNTDLGHLADRGEVYFKIYQLSALVGRGFPLTVVY